MEEAMSDLLTVEELAKQLRVPNSWVYSRTRLKGPDTIPAIRVGKYLRFRLADVLSWMEVQGAKN